MTKKHERVHYASMVLAFMLGFGCIVLPVKAVEFSTTFTQMSLAQA